MKLKRGITLILTGLIAISAFGGCSNIPNTPESSAQSSDASPTASSEDTSGTEAVTLKILGGFDANVDPENDPVKKEIEERTGYKLEYFMLPQDNADEKLSLEITSGADYDILMLSPDQFRMLARQNALMDISGLVDEYGPTIKEVIAEDTWKLTTLGENIYAIPQKNERPNIEASLAIRSDLLEAAGLEIPTDIHQFKQALITIKEQNPDIIPFTHLTNLNVPVIRSAFGIYGSSATDGSWLLEDGHIINWIESKHIKDYFQYMLELNEAGLIDKDLPVNKATNRDEKFTSGRAAAMHYDWFSSDKIEPALTATDPNAKIALVPPLSGDLGFDPGVVSNIRFLKASAIPKNAKHPEDAIKFMDTKLEWENFLNLTLGEEGRTFEIKDGKYFPIMPTFNETRSTAYFYLNGINEEKYADMWLCRVRRNEYVGNTFDKINADYDKYAKFDPVALMPAMESVSKYQASLNKLVNDYQIKLLTGGESLENYDTFLAQWREAGGEAMTKEVDEWYQANK